MTERFCRTETGKGGMHMDEDRTLIIGLDLCDDYSQISCIRKNGQLPLGEPESVCMTPDKTKYLIPTAVCVRENSKEWIIGEEAERCRERQAGQYVDGLFSMIENDSSATIYDVEFTGEMLLERFLRKLLGIIRQRYQNNSILQIVVTLPGNYRKTEAALPGILEKLGIGEDRAQIINHTLAFMYYVVSQPKDQWVNDVALFEYGIGGLQFYQLSFGRKSLPNTVVAEHTDLSDKIPYEMYLHHVTDRLTKGFETESNMALYKKLITSVFVSGRGFEGTWADNVLRNMCMGRRVFKGQNLYAKGACYAAASLINNTLTEYIFLSEDRITSDISLKVVSNGEEQLIPLANVGEPWQTAGRKCRVIPDGNAELEFLVSDCIRKDSVQEIVRLDSPVRRENKTVRLELALRFEDRRTAVVKISDTGFGEFFKSSYRVWEQILKL